MIATPASQQARRFSADQRGRAATRRLLVESACVFLLAVLIATQWASLLAEDHIKVQRVAAVDAARAGVTRLQLNIDHALSATTALAALVRQGGGKVANFEAVGAEILTLYPGIGALQLAPDGVVHQVVPRAGNEKALGHNLLADPLRTQEAFLARDTGRLTLAGPFELMQGRARRCRAAAGFSATC